MLRSVTPTLAAAFALAAGLAVAQEALTPEQAEQARSELMKGQGQQLGVLGGMAQGEVAYDAAVAQAAADALLALANQAVNDALWPEGSAVGEVEGSRALPAIWENPEDWDAKQAALVEAATAMQAAAGTDLASLQAAMAGVGSACGACHELYRAPEQ